jgi:hypothetical protein
MDSTRRRAEILTVILALSAAITAAMPVVVMYQLVARMENQTILIGSEKRLKNLLRRTKRTIQVM